MCLSKFFVAMPEFGKFSRFFLVFFECLGWYLIQTETTQSKQKTLNILIYVYKKKEINYNQLFFLSFLLPFDLICSGLEKQKSTAGERKNNYKIPDVFCDYGEDFEKFHFSFFFRLQTRHIISIMSFRGGKFDFYFFKGFRKLAMRIIWAVINYFLSRLSCQGNFP